MPIEQLIWDPIGFIQELLWYLPAVLLALTLHECSHGWWPTGAATARPR